MRSVLFGSSDFLVHGAVYFNKLESTTSFDSVKLYRLYGDAVGNVRQRVIELTPAHVGSDGVRCVQQPIRHRVSSEG